MSLIYWDSMLFVYLLEAHPQYGPPVEQIFREMTRRGDRLCTGTLTIGEVLTGPYKMNKLSEVEEFSEFFDSEFVDVLPFTKPVAYQYARIRAKHKVTPGDAFHLAIASVSNVDLYLTNDKKIRNLAIDGIKFIAGLDGKIF